MHGQRVKSRMASAAAVGASIPLSPPQNDIGEDGGLPGEITSAIGSKQDGGLVEEGDLEGDEDDDIRGTARRRGAAGAVNGDDDEDLPEDPLGADLFGDDEDEETAEHEKPARRQLDDEELDSGDDVDRTDRVGEEEPATQEQEYETQEKVMMDLEMARQPLPEPSDGEVCAGSRRGACVPELTEADVPLEDARLHGDRATSLLPWQLRTSHHRPPFEQGSQCRLLSLQYRPFNRAMAAFTLESIAATVERTHTSVVGRLADATAGFTTERAVRDRR